MTIASLVPNLMVEDVRRSAEFWCGKLGFEPRMSVDASKGFHHGLPAEGEIVYAQFVSGTVEVMVQRRDSIGEELPGFAQRPTGGGFTLYVQVDDLDAMFERLENELTTVKDLHTTFYGMREWYVSDPDGVVVCLAQQA